MSQTPRRDFPYIQVSDEVSTRCSSSMTDTDSQKTITPSTSRAVKGTHTSVTSEHVCLQAQTLLHNFKDVSSLMDYDGPPESRPFSPTKLERSLSSRSSRSASKRYSIMSIYNPYPQPQLLRTLSARYTVASSAWRPSWNVKAAALLAL